MLSLVKCICRSLSFPAGSQRSLAIGLLHRNRPLHCLLCSRPYSRFLISISLSHWQASQLLTAPAPRNLRDRCRTTIRLSLRSHKINQRIMMRWRSLRKKRSSKARVTANQKVLTTHRELKPKSTACFMGISPLTTSRESQKRKRSILSCTMSS